MSGMKLEVELNAENCCQREPFLKLADMTFQQNLNSMNLKPLCKNFPVNKKEVKDILNSFLIIQIISPSECSARLNCPKEPLLKLARRESLLNGRMQAGGRIPAPQPRSTFNRPHCPRCLYGVAETIVLKGINPDRLWCQNKLKTFRISVD